MLYLKNIKREKKDTLFTFLNKCMLNENRLFFTQCQFPKTYKDKDCTIRECDEKYRSFEAIVEISKTYFKVSEKQVAKTIKKILLNKEKMGFLYCLFADKWIFYYGSSMAFANKERFILDYSSSLCKTNKKGSGKYTFNEIENLMNS